jgi:hypothetical protein
MSVNGYSRVIVCDICGLEQAAARLPNGDGICNTCSYTVNLNPYHAFHTRLGRIAWFWDQYRSYPLLPFWWCAKEWWRCELRHGLRRK